MTAEKIKELVEMAASASHAAPEVCQEVAFTKALDAVIYDHQREQELAANKTT